MGGQIFNIPASCSFVDVLAEKFSQEYQDNPAGLAEVLFLMPNRRACVSLKDAFVRVNGLQPAILPQIVPVGDMEEDEVFFNSAYAAEVLEQLPPAIDSYERLFLFAKLVVAKPVEYGLPEMTFDQALALAHDLGKLIDISYNEQLSFDKLKDLVPEQYASHWQETLNFLSIITQYWPQILKEKNVIDEGYRKNVLLEAQSDFWEKNMPQGRIVAAGVSAAFPGIKKLLKVLSELSCGEVYLCGLDRHLDEDAWAQIDESHPQFEHKNLLDFLKKLRLDIPDIVPSVNQQREELLSEIMRPAQSTMQWRVLNQQTLNPEAFNGIHLINCDDIRQEAASVALLMREALNISGKTAALVTSDRELARRTASELERWNIKVDDSAGKPLHLTPIGIFLRLVPFVLESDFSEASLRVLAKNPFVRLGMEVVDLRRNVRQWEHCKRSPIYSESPVQVSDTLQEWLVTLKEILLPMQNLYTQNLVSFKDIVETHLKVAEALASENMAMGGKSGAQILWRGDDGKSAATLFSKILPQAEILGQISPRQYLRTLTVLMSSQTVRPSYGTHPRLKILGPIEARFNHFDTVIIGGVNEGVWPKLPQSDPWMSRPMKKDFGMSLPEKAIGIMAADFSQLMCAPSVYLTRANRANGTPMNKSRWLLRLETVLKAYGQDADVIKDFRYRQLARYLDTPEKFSKILPPAPCPPVSARPRKLSASSIEKLMRDPYEVYAAKILHLKKLKDLDDKFSPSDYGTIVHKVLELFNSKYPKHLPDNAKDELLKLAVEQFLEYNVAPEVRAFWWPNFLKTVDWLLKLEANYRQDVAAIFSEVQGALEFDAPAGNFKVTARADRVDMMQNGTLNVIDYKTGEPRTPKEVAAGYAPQLPIEGLIAQRGGFVKDSQAIAAAPIDKLIYWKLGEKSVEISSATDKLLDDTLERLQKLIAAFDFESTAYLARPNPKHILKYSDYEHLARVKEWSVENDDAQ